MSQGDSAVTLFMYGNSLTCLYVAILALGPGLLSFTLMWWLLGREEAKVVAAANKKED